MKKTANEFIHTNEEYVKLRNGRAPGVDMPPRETPSGQGPGGRGHSKANFSSWTTEELRSHAEGLELPGAKSASRKELIDLIQGSNAARHRENTT